MSVEQQPKPSTNEEKKQPASIVVRCKVCGYITESGKIKDLCPACGVKAAMFEPLTERFSDKRRKFLNLHIHPIIVHFPQAFAIVILVLSIGIVLFSGNIEKILRDALTVMVIALPFTLVASFVSGIIDGKVRYKKIATPYLHMKIVTGIVYILLSTAAAAILFVNHWMQTPLVYVMIIISLGLVGCTSFLGKIGAELSYAKMPG